MKTIQQVLRELDHDSIENEYFVYYPIELGEITGRE